MPYYPLTDEMLGDIVRLQLDRIARRVARAPQVPFTYDDDGGQADRHPLHRGRERRPHDRRDPHQHGAAADLGRIPDPDEPGEALRGIQLGAGPDGDFAYLFD